MTEPTTPRKRRGVIVRKSDGSHTTTLFAPRPPHTERVTKPEVKPEPESKPPES